MIDTHTHVTFPEFDDDREEVLSRAWEAGLEFLIAVGAGQGLDGNIKAIELAKKHDRIFATVGVHPHDAKEMTDGWIAKLEKLAAHKKVVAIGEIGLDYHYMHSPKEVQIARLRDLLALAKRVDKPIIIHARDAHEDVWREMTEAGVPSRGGVFHCFSGDVEFAKKVVDAGFHISIPGVVTFKNARVLQEVVAEIPLERLLLETDCPYLAPVPFRGKRNEPAYVVEVAKKIAEIKGLAFEDVSRVTTLAAKRLFSLPGAELESHIAYRIRNSLYLNITNRCNMACRFCPKYADFEVKGYYLKLAKEPSIDEIFCAIGEPLEFDEVVFCGYGEPTLRLDVIKEIAARMKERGVKRIRLNTDGLANLVYGRNILPELANLIDAISVSLNAADASTHAKICPSKYKEAAFEAVCDFITEAKKYISEVTATVVALPDLDIKPCRKKAKELGVPLRVRKYMNVG
ncbi:MAG: TatD family hydrolase [Pseudomonadota bacterium]